MTSILLEIGSKYTDEREKLFLFFSNPILFLFVIHTDCEKQLISPLGFVKFFHPAHCWQQTHENETIATTYSRNLPC
jgi:hypothetical protein